MKKFSSCVIITTTDLEEVANIIATSLVESKLAACIQREVVDSIFEYEGELQKISEFRLTIKAASEKYPAIEEMIKSHHNYSIPQIIKLDITDGLPAYLEWICK